MNEQEITEKIMEMLCENLGLDPKELTEDIPLFEGGMALDSIDSLEIIAGIDEEFNVDMTGVGRESFYNVKTLTAYVMQQLENHE